MYGVYVYTKKGLFFVEEKQNEKYAYNDDRRYYLEISNERNEILCSIRNKSLSEYANKRYNGFLCGKLRKLIESKIMKQGITL